MLLLQLRALANGLKKTKDYNNLAVTLPVKGLTVKRTNLVTVVIEVVVPLVVVLSPEVLVPALTFGEPFGNNWFVTIWTVSKTFNTHQVAGIRLDRG